jgi:hypothetical protein
MPLVFQVRVTMIYKNQEPQALIQNGCSPRVIVPLEATSHHEAPKGERNLRVGKSQETWVCIPCLWTAAPMAGAPHEHASHPSSSSLTAGWEEQWWLTKASLVPLRPWQMHPATGFRPLEVDAPNYCRRYAPSKQLTPVKGWRKVVAAEEKV